jgi:fused signal recognition particle receptor
MLLQVSFSLANFSIKGLFGGTSAATPEEAPAQPKEDEAAIAAATNAQRVEEERLAAEKAAAEKLAEGERVAAAEQKKKAEEERDAAEAKTLEEERIATEKKKIEEERIAAEKAAAEQKAAEERIAAAEEKAEEERVAAANRKKKADQEKIVTSASLASCEAREMSGENQSREWQVERRAMEAKLGDALKAQANAERELASVRKELERESKALADKDAFTEEMGEELVGSLPSLPAIFYLHSNRLTPCCDSQVMFLKHFLILMAGEVEA